MPGRRPTSASLTLPAVLASFDDPGNFPYHRSLHGSPTRGMIAEHIVEG